MNNRYAKKQLIQLYGPECFIEKLHLRHDKKIHYTSVAQMQKMKQLTYHHILERQYGGKSTIKNGALLSRENHIWFHRQPESVRSALNKKFKKYKACKVVFVDTPPTHIRTKPFELNLNKVPYNRDHMKKETKQLLDEDLER